MDYMAGLDFGTSGARLAVLDTAGNLVAEVQQRYGAQPGTDWPQVWLTALAALFQGLPAEVRQGIVAIACNGTSATVLLCDEVGRPLTAPLLYNDDRGQNYGPELATLVPAGSPARSATSSLAKLLWWRDHLAPTVEAQVRYLMHQADWLAWQFHGQLGLSDYHNALKLGYDVGRLAYPEALQTLAQSAWLPQVQAPGTCWGRVTAAAQQRYGLSSDCAVFAGTTDSIGAFLASGARSPGAAVTSLGSTLVIKLLSATRVDDTRYGIYSHRLGDLWLVGGASNTGGAVLQQFFTPAELAALSARIPSDRPSDLAYYPLPRPGERFPISDPDFPPQLTPRPAAPEHFLHGLLEGMARIEALGYQRLQELGATPLTRVYTAGGGAQNLAWTAIRQRYLPVPVECAQSTEAAVGTARLALSGWQGRLAA